MRSLGFPELLVILGVAVLLFGGKKIPEVAKGLGEGIRNFKNALKGDEEKVEEKKQASASRRSPQVGLSSSRLHKVRKQKEIRKQNNPARSIGPRGVLFLQALRRRFDYFAFFGGTIASFALLATRNFTTFLAAILMASPVAGLRPMRALRSTRTSRPMPGSTNTPFFFTSATAMVSSLSSIARATLLLTSQVSASDRTSCVWVILTFAIFLL